MRRPSFPLPICAISVAGTFKKDRCAKQRQALEQLRDILTSDGRTLAQAALGALWARSERIIPIPGFKTMAQVKENVGALQYGPLSPQQMKAIADLVASSLTEDETEPF